MMSLSLPCCCLNSGTIFTSRSRASGTFQILGRAGHHSFHCSPLNSPAHAIETQMVAAGRPQRLAEVVRSEPFVCSASNPKSTIAGDRVASRALLSALAALIGSAFSLWPRLASCARHMDNL